MNDIANCASLLELILIWFVKGLVQIPGLVEILYAVAVMEEAVFPKTVKALSQDCRAKWLDASLGGRKAMNETKIDSF